MNLYRPKDCFTKFRTKMGVNICEKWGLLFVKFSKKNIGLKGKYLPNNVENGASYLQDFLRNLIGLNNKYLTKYVKNGTSYLKGFLRINDGLIYHEVLYWFQQSNLGGQQNTGMPPPLS